MSGEPLSARLRLATRSLHRTAESSGVMGALLRGRLDERGYVALLRNLHAIYAALEAGLVAQAGASHLASLGGRALFRASALAEDLAHFRGPTWGSLPIADATAAYVERLDDVARGAPLLLVAHAYVRYLGDLNGGQLLAGIVRRAYGLHDGPGAAFYEFTALDVARANEVFRTGLDTLGATAQETAAIVDEACAAFERHVRVFQALDRPGKAALESPDTSSPSSP